MKKYSALILDDDIENIKLLSIYINKYFKNINIIATVNDIENCIEAYYTYLPDLLFLDVELEGNETSFNFLESIEHIKSKTIFISSYDEYAIKAINLDVVGYILKPIKINELVKVVDKAISQIKKEATNLDSHKLSSNNIIAIPSASKVELVPVQNIVYLEADGRYTIFHLSNGSNRVSSRNLGEYEKMLNKSVFFRIHHRYIVNLNMVNNINKTAGNYCELLNNKALPIAKRRQESLNKFLNLK
ncbi:LytTR family DNA-binding domain-containing protein [Algibacter agarivorans]|uniref:LytTR family DNA-binding domain-containing protein n=1 Tax=Algibacter agarivorans TaxID=1109741 RepID=A0ABP9GB20_9FLAO